VSAEGCSTAVVWLTEEVRVSPVLPLQLADSRTAVHRQKTNHRYPRFTSDPFGISKHGRLEPLDHAASWAAIRLPWASSVASV
jgi:hypothetical protein